VNLLLFDPGELTGDVLVVADRRAHHLRTVLGVAIGSQVRVGEVGGRTGRGEVIADDGSAYTLRIALDTPPAGPLDLDLVLAVPRPKVITRTLEIAASFAVRRIELTNAWRVDKSYLKSPRLDPQAMAMAARFGAEQGATTHIPEIALHDRLMALLDARFPEPGGLRLLAHPSAPPIEAAILRKEARPQIAASAKRERSLGGPNPSTGEPTVLAIGPEGGWIEREVDTFVARGFTPVSIGTPILRVEAAVASALGQLLLLQRLRG
jgi:RsmE family RNA methyltransferase